MDEIVNLDSLRSVHREPGNRVFDVDDLSSVRSRVLSRSGIDARSLNADEPRPAVQPGDSLQAALRSVDRRAGPGIRLPLPASRTMASVRIIPDGDQKSNREQRSARSYKPTDHTSARPAKNMSDSERAYVYRQKFHRLHMQNRSIEIPETNDPDALERCYQEAMRTLHYSSTSPTWLLYMGFGYAGFQWVLGKFKVKLPAEFVPIQLEVMSHYPHLLKALGDPGGPSIGSNWPPWMKLAFVIALQTIIFVLVYKVTGNNTIQAHNVQRFICQTGIMGGAKQGDELAADSATSGLGGMLGNLFSGGGGGLGGMVGKLMGALGGGGGTAMDNFDPENPPPPASERSLPGEPSVRSISRRDNPFDK